MGDSVERYIAIDNVCAWPNLTLLPDGTLTATIYSQPVHGRWVGDVELWVSTDDGRLWQKRSAAVPAEPPGNRMDVAAGLAANGDLIVISSGWNPVQAPGTDVPDFDFSASQCLYARVCRSADAGHTWERADTVTVPDDPEGWCIPFGDIVEGPDGLAAAFYTGPKDDTRNSAWMLRSTDDGRTWGDGSLIVADDYNETDILHLGAGRWLAVCRTKLDYHVQLFASDDDGRSWQDRGPLTQSAEHPAHLLRLADGRILFTFGIRIGKRGVGARFSDDEGASWSRPRILVRCEGASDGGYPSSCQMADGTIVTAYYTNRIDAHARYHMGVVRWLP